MTLTTFQVATAVTPTVVKTCVSHYANRKPRHKKPTAHISYDEGLHLIRQFLKYASHKTVDELQAFTAQWVPTPTWVRTENVTIPQEHITRAAEALIAQLGPDGVKAVGGREWWQWRRNKSDLRAEWVEMSSNYQQRRRENKQSRRIMLYVHGGGYFFGSVDEHRYQLQRHARKLQARVIAPRYRLAPQFPFPCGLLDCLAVYLYLLTLQDHTEVILAGDSAGGGMVVSMLCLIRDQGLPLPAGAVLISPWVDLTHSFPSVSEVNPLDYIPPHGFHHKPSVAWPPPNDDDMEAIQKVIKGQTREEAFMEKSTDLAAKLGVTAPDNNDPGSRVANRVPAPDHFLSIELNDKLVVIKEQIQMYATNQLLSNPLVSPVLQPSLGGLPPLLILVGGGEMLRDEQIYLGHKAANPHKYHLSDVYRMKYDPDDTILNKYKPTPVQLQVWEDLCHVAPTLSFTRPAKYMYRSIAQFGAWALARAQDRPIEITDDDNISIISSESEQEQASDSTDSIEKMKGTANKKPELVGRAGDPLPFFRNHMIRQQVDRYGNITELPSADRLPATSMDSNEVGLIKPGPVGKWMQAKDEWASKYASAKRRVQKMRVEAIRSKHHIPFGPDENPPASALAARRTAQEVAPKQRKSYGLAMWSMWGSKHDEATLKREDELVRSETQALPSVDTTTPETNGITPAAETPLPPTIQEPTSAPTSPSPRARRSSRRRASSQTSATPRERRRTISVTDRGQAGALLEDPDQPDLPPLPTHTSQLDPSPLLTPPAISTTTTHPTSPSPQSANTTTPPPALFLPKFRTASHLQHPSLDATTSDAASTRTGYSALSTSNASTRAVFSAAGISKPTSSSDPSSIAPPNGSGVVDSHSHNMDEAGGHSEDGSVTPQALSLVDTADDSARRRGGGTDTPVSRLSVERLRAHNAEFEAELRVAAAALPAGGVDGGVDGEGGGGGGGEESAEDGNRRALARAQTMGEAEEAEGETRWLGRKDGIDGGSGGGLGRGLGARLEPLRSPSSVAIVGAEGVVGVVSDGQERSR